MVKLPAALLDKMRIMPHISIANQETGQPLEVQLDAVLARLFKPDPLPKQGIEVAL